MDFNLTEEHELIRQSVREFSDRHVSPIADEVDQEPRFPAETIRKLAEQELMGIPFPAEYGGGEADYLTYIIALEELSRACTTTGFTVHVHTSQAAFPIFKFGTEEQKKRFLTPLCKGELLGSLALAELEGGIGQSAETATAVADGGEWVLNAARLYVPNASEAGVILVFAATDPSKGADGFSAFILPGGTPGFSVTRQLNKVGIRGAIMAEVSLEECRIPKANLLGSEGQGAEIASAILDCSRIGVAAGSVGIVQAALEESIEYSKQRVQFGVPIATFDAVQAMIANMAISLDAARLLTYHAAWSFDQDLPYGTQAAIAKSFATDMAYRHTNRGVQVYGGIGYVKGTKVERLYRDAMIGMSFTGTNETMSTLIAKELLR